MNIKRIVKYFLFKLVIISFLLLGFFVNANMLDEAYEKSEDYYIKKGGEIIGDSGSSIFVKGSEFLLKVTIAFGITMILYGSFMIVMSIGDEGKMKKARFNIILVIMGLLLALSSVVVITLIESITKSTITV